jgi:hypothetical protein
MWHVSNLEHLRLQCAEPQEVCADAGASVITVSMDIPLSLAACAEAMFQFAKNMLDLPCWGAVCSAVWPGFFGAWW